MSFAGGEESGLPAKSRFRAHKARFGMTKFLGVRNKDRALNPRAGFTRSTYGCGGLATPRGAEARVRQ